MSQKKNPSSKPPDWLPELEKWENADYDGIKGFPPPWVPEPFRDKFSTQRLLLLLDVQGNKATYAEINSRFTDLVEKKHHAIVLALLKDKKPYDDSLHYLVDFYKAVKLGKTEGLRKLAGEKSAKGEKFSSGGTSKRGKEYEPKLSIRRICKEINSTKFDDVLNFLRDGKQCAGVFDPQNSADLFELTENPTGVLFTRVYDDRKVITYVKRGDSTDNQKQITFRTLRNILAKEKT